MSDTTLAARLREMSRRGYWPILGDEAADLLEQQAAEIAEKDHQLQAAKTIIAGLDERALHQSREFALLKTASADVAGERGANALLTSEVEALRADAERLDWLAPRLFSADFAYGDPPICAIVFEWPATASVGADLRASIDAALRQEQQT